LTERRSIRAAPQEPLSLAVRNVEQRVKIAHPRYVHPAGRVWARPRRVFRLPWRREGLANCTMDSKVVLPLRWRRSQSSSARRVEKSLGAKCPGGRTRCPLAPAAGAARSCGYGTGCGAERASRASVTSALESDRVAVILAPGTTT
jgi:hypothetical protein